MLYQEISSYENCPPTRVFLVLKVNFLAYLLCNQGVRESGLLRDQEVGGSNPLAPTNSPVKINYLQGNNLLGSPGVVDFGYVKVATISR